MVCEQIKDIRGLLEIQGRNGLIPKTNDCLRGLTVCCIGCAIGFMNLNNVNPQIIGSDPNLIRYIRNCLDEINHTASVLRVTRNN